VVALFTALAPDHLEDICARYGVGRPSRTTAIAAGTINSNFSVHTETGRYFLRVNEGKSLEDVAWESQLVDWLAHHGFPTPSPLLAPDGAGYLAWRDKLLTLFPWSQGEHVAASQLTAVQVARLGQVLAQLHRLGELAPPTWMRRSVYDQAHLRRRFDGILTRAPSELGRALTVLTRAMSEAEAAESIRAASTRTLVHGDLFRDNVLWSGERLIAILDFEQASQGTVAYDVAVCLNDWCWDQGPRPDLAAALVEGYQRERSLSAADRAALPIEVKAAAMRFTITRITDVYLAQIDHPEKDFRDFLARVEAWQSPLLGEFLRSV
jgi:homoserine kinase type II